MRYAQMRRYDVANGVGIRTTLFVSGCHFHCKNCINSEYWPFEYGEEYTDVEMQKFIDMGKVDNVTGYSILGGEPMDQLSDNMLLKTVQEIKKQTGKTIWMWSGWTYENMNEKQREILKYVDVLVDGQFVDEKKNLKLLFRGSENQRIIDVPKTLAQGEVVLWEHKE